MAQIFRPSTNTLYRASIVGGALNPNALAVARYPLARSGISPGPDHLSRLPEIGPWNPLPATKDTLAESARSQVIATHHTHSRGGKAAEHTP